jgi:hypothetical protein
MIGQHPERILFTAAAVCGLGFSSVALAYDGDDAIRDCNSRMKSEYNDIGMRSGHDAACTPAQLSAANKAVNKELSNQRANAN